MAEEPKDPSQQIDELRERSKELRCLYEIEDLMNRPEANIAKVCRGVVQAIPQGWRFPDACQVKLVLENNTYQSSHFRETPWNQSADIVVQGRTVGKLTVYYTRDLTVDGKSPFLPEEERLLKVIAERLAHYIMFREFKQALQEKMPQIVPQAPRKSEWQVVLDLLRQTDKALYFNIAHKMLNHLCWTGIAAAEELRNAAGTFNRSETLLFEQDPNRPYPKTSLEMTQELVEKTFKIAADHLSDQEILTRVQKWIQEDKLSYFVQVANRNLPLAEVVDAIRRYRQFESEGQELQSPSRQGIKVSLIRRFFSDQLPFISIAKDHFEISDFYDLVQRIIYSAESHGRLGGKSAGLYLAMKILKNSRQHADILANVKMPKTWHITSDMMYSFMHYNNFDDIIEQKYKDREQIRSEYPHIVQTFKNSSFPMEMVKGISLALDDFEERPLIVRSSSLLEDGMGAVFSGKYKSLFLSNRGTRRERLYALLDAIAEVYASTFASDPIEYRTEHGLLDFGEEMGIMIQEVVGTRIGPYLMPIFAGVAFSNNEFRWSPRIKRADGLIRLVPGLGTRAVDRLADDYPVLIAPGQPTLRVNASVDEVLRYAPRYADVINLETKSFETVEIISILRRYGHAYPMIDKIISIHDDGVLRKPNPNFIDFAKDDMVVTFEGLVTDTNFIKQMRTILNVLEEKLGMPVDIEFAYDGTDFYLLQCRSQSHAEESKPAHIPADIPEERIIFSSNRNVSNGRVPDITHIVYVDPFGYAAIPDRETMLEIGRAVGKLNKILPRRRFILMGPGRWGSRGDIRLGVSVTYSDINNAAMIIEMARRTGQYLPDLSFGTHFFQDLVEANIRYLPLYPDEPGTIFNESFFLESPNLLAQLLPIQSHLATILRVIDVPAATGGQVLRVLMNADLDRAVAILCSAPA